MARRRAHASALVFASSIVTACFSSDSDLEGTRWRCETTEDCGSGWQCDTDEKACVRAYQNENGVTSDTLTLGMIAALDTKTVPGLAFIGLASRDGIEAYFAHVNRTGGVHGRRLLLESRNDNYDPNTTTQQLEDLAGGSNRKVYALINVLGTGPSLATVDFITKNSGPLLFAPGSGDEQLEQGPPHRYVFNVRVRYYEEAIQLCDYMIDTDEPRVPARNIAVFAQGTAKQGEPDSFGRGVAKGAGFSLHAHDVDRSTLKVATYAAGTIDVEPGISSLLRWMSAEERVQGAVSGAPIHVGIAMAALADAMSVFIKGITDAIVAAKNYAKVKDEEAKRVLEGYGITDEVELARLGRIELHFATLSTVGFTVIEKLKSYNSYQLFDLAGGKRVVQERRRYGVGTLFALPVPDVSSDSVGVDEYRKRLKAYIDEANERLGPGEPKREYRPDPFSLEGYLAAALLGEALVRHGRDLTTKSLIDTLVTKMRGVDNLGFGVTFEFSPNRHQANSRMWGAQLDDNLELKQLGLLIPQ